MPPCPRLCFKYLVESSCWTRSRATMHMRDAARRKNSSQSETLALLEEAPRRSASNATIPPLISLSGYRVRTCSSPPALFGPISHVLPSTALHAPKTAHVKLSLQLYRNERSARCSGIVVWRTNHLQSPGAPYQFRHVCLSSCPMVATLSGQNIC